METDDRVERSRNGATGVGIKRVYPQITQIGTDFLTKEEEVFDRIYRIYKMDVK